MRIPVEISPLAACEKDKNKKESQGVRNCALYGEARWRCKREAGCPATFARPGPCWPPFRLVFAWPINSVRCKSGLNGPQTYVPPAVRVASLRQRRKHKAQWPRKQRGTPLQHTRRKRTKGNYPPAACVGRPGERHTKALFGPPRSIVGSGRRKRCGGVGERRRA